MISMSVQRDRRARGKPCPGLDNSKYAGSVLIQTQSESVCVIVWWEVTTSPKGYVDLSEIEILGWGETAGCLLLSKQHARISGSWTSHLHPRTARIRVVGLESAIRGAGFGELGN
jgi:hypothetical protein